MKTWIKQKLEALRITIIEWLGVATHEDLDDLEVVLCKEIQDVDGKCAEFTDVEQLKDEVGALQSRIETLEQDQE